jgi:branched-chain amino acid transport system substrate-binding protein
LLVLMLAMSLVAIGCPTPPPEKELKIGAFMGLSGAGSETLSTVADGVTLAADWVNDNGGLTINGEKYLIKLIGEDYKMSIDGIVAAANKLVYEDQVKFIVCGAPIPPFRAAVAEMTESNKVLRMAIDGVGTPDELNLNMPYTFATMFTIACYGIGYEALLELYPEVKTVALTCPEDPGAIADMAYNKKVAEAHGLTVVAEETYPFGTADYYPMWTKVLAAKPDAWVESSGFPEWIGGIIKQGRELGFEGPMFMLSFTGGDPYVIRDIAGKYATDYVTLTCDIKSPKMTPMIKEIDTLISDKLGEEMRMDHIGGFEAIWLLAQAIEEAQSIDSTVVRDTFEKMEDLESPFGTCSMGGLETCGINHVIIRPVCLTHVMNGEVEHLEWLMPELP